MQVTEVKDVLSPVAQVGVVGAFCILFIVVTGYLFKWANEKQKELRVSSAEELKAERFESAKEREKLMDEFKAIFNEVRIDARETKSELKNVIEKNTTGFVELNSTIKSLQKDIERKN